MGTASESTGLWSDIHELTVRSNAPMAWSSRGSRIFDRLNKYAGQWVAEVPAILWSLRTTPNQSIGFTPFFLAYRAEAVLPSDLDHDTPRVKAFDHDRATEAQQDAIDLLEEARETIIIHSAHYQQTLRRYHERKIRGRILEVGDLML